MKSHDTQDANKKASQREEVLRKELMASRSRKPPTKALAGAFVALVLCVVVIVVAAVVVGGLDA